MNLMRKQRDIKKIKIKHWTKDINIMKNRNANKWVKLIWMRNVKSRSRTGNICFC